MLISIDGMSHTGRRTLAFGLGRSLSLPVLDVDSLWSLLALQLAAAGHKPDNAPEALERAAHTIISMGLDTMAIVDGFKGLPALVEFGATLQRFPLLRTRIVNVARDWLVTMKQEAIVFGTDTGRSVAPHADHQFFLIGDALVRARRRSGETGAVNLTELRATCLADDKREITRFASPLRPTQRAILIDTTHTSTRQVHNHACEVIATHQKWAAMEAEALKL